MVFYALVLLLTLIAYGLYRYQKPDKPPHHKYFILAALGLGALIAVCDVQSSDADSTAVTFFRLIHLTVYGVIAAACFAGYKVIQMAPDRRRVPLAWVIGLYLIVYIGVNGFHFYREAAAIRCDDPDAMMKQSASKSEIIEASIMYQRICNKGATDLRGDMARMIHGPAEKK
jgi:hypothetical protein